MSSIDSEIKHDLRARTILSERIGNKGALMIQADGAIRAYLEDPADYSIAADALGVAQDDLDDLDELNDALWDAYIEACEQAKREIREETEEREEQALGGQTEHWLHTWEGPTGWFACFSGLSRDGFYSESSEDLGPFESREEARNAATVEIEV